MRIVDPETFEELPERHVGELLIRGTSVTPGYYKRPDATAELFHDGWLCTGDLGYLLDGELVLCGRIKDVIIVGGRNVFPEDIERAVGASTACAPATSSPSGGGLQGQGERRRRGRGAGRRAARPRRPIRDAIHHRTLEVCGLPPRDVMLVQPGTLPKTSSGKLQRAKCREQYLDETLELASASEHARSFASDRHRLHDPEHEIESSALQAPFEHPGRAEAIRAALAADGTFTFAEPAPAGTGADRGGARPRARALPRHRRGRSTSATCARPTTSCPTCSRWPGCATAWGRPAGAAGVGARLGWWCFETTTPLTEGTYEAARSAVDCALAADRRPCSPASAVAYGLCRPPGHHATTSLYGGYCFFNNAAIAALHVASTTGGRVAVLDVDYHHGNGTQQIFYERDDVPFVSLHGDPARAYPYLTGLRRRDRRRAGARARRATCRCRPAPTTTPTSPRSSGRSTRSTRSIRRSWSCRSASTRTSTTRSATSR